jgi:hypothetical protein
VCIDDNSTLSDNTLNEVELILTLLVFSVAVTAPLVFNADPEVTKKSEVLVTELTTYDPLGAAPDPNANERTVPTPKP